MNGEIYLIKSPSNKIYIGQTIYDHMTRWRDHIYDALDPKKDHCCDKWIDVTRRETLEGAEQAIDASISHYAKKLEYIKGPKVIKTFE